MVDTSREDRPFVAPQPTTPSGMMGHRGAPPGAPPMPWRKYVFYVLGFPIKTPKARDSWITPSDDAPST